MTKWLQFFVADTQEEFHGGLFEAEKFGKISGFYMASQGACGFAAASFRDMDEVRRGIRHEVQGHFALNTCAHGEKRAVLERIVQTRSDPAWSDYWENVDKNYVGLTDQAKAEEIYALIAETVDIVPSNAIAQNGKPVFDALIQGEQQAIRPEDVWQMSTMITRGLHTGERIQQIFPEEDNAQFSLGQKQPLSVAEVRNELIDFCRLYPAVARSGVRLMVRDTEQELFDELYPDERTFGRSGCAYLPGRSILAVAASAYDGQRRNPGRIQREILGHISINTFGDAEKGILIDALLEARDNGWLDAIWTFVQDRHGYMDIYQQAEMVYVQAADALPQQVDGVAAERGQKIEQSIRDGALPDLDLESLHDLQSWVQQGMAEGHRLLQIRSANDQDQFNDAGFTLDHAKREVRDFVRQYPSIARDVQFRLRYSQIGAFYNEKGTAEAREVSGWRGTYFPARRRAVLAVASHDLTEFRRTLGHELLGHYSTYTVHPGEKRKLLTALLASRTQPEISDLWHKVDRLYPYSMGSEVQWNENVR